MKNTLAKNAENTSWALSSDSTYSTGEAPACVLSLLSQESHTYKWSWSSTEGHRERYRQPGASGQNMGLGKGHALGMLSAQVQKCYRYTKWSWITLHSSGVGFSIENGDMPSCSFLYVFTQTCMWKRDCCAYARWEGDGSVCPAGNLGRWILMTPPLESLYITCLFHIAVITMGAW